MINFVNNIIDIIDTKCYISIGGNRRLYTQG